MKPELTSNMKEFISAGSSSMMTFYNAEILYQAENSDIQVGFHNILDDYMDEIKSTCKLLELTKSQLDKYKFKPWLLSYDIYGTTDLEFLILKINNMVSAKQFNKARLNMVTPTGIQLINKIYNAEKKYIRKNRSELE